MIEKLLHEQADPNSKAAQEIIEEVAERVLRDLNPESQNHLSALSKSNVA